MKTSKSGKMVRNLVRGWRGRGETIGFVPTMGNLHEGHLSLVRKARARCERIMVSIFVNPTQFAPQEDFDSYPRTVSRDLALLREFDVDCCFMPSRGEMYGGRELTQIRMPALETILEGKPRPTHFAGVLLVVLKLLHIVEPDVLVMGQKDAQQAVVLETMVRDLNLAVKVIRGRIVREKNGLAMSSRNAYLSPEERNAATALHRGLVRARKKAIEGETSAARLCQAAMREIRREALLKVDYVACVDARTLAPLSRASGPVLMPAAVYAGKTRLIDNEQFVIRGSS